MMVIADAVADLTHQNGRTVLLELRWPWVAAWRD